SLVLYPRLDHRSNRTLYMRLARFALRCPSRALLLLIFLLGLVPPPTPDFGFWILDFGPAKAGENRNGRSAAPEIQNPKSKIQNPAQAAIAFADPTFQRVWARSDEPLAAGSVTRSWVRGP